MPLTAAEQEELARLKAEVAGESAGEAPVKAPTFLEQLGQAFQREGDRQATMMGMLPGPLGALGAGLGHLGKNLGHGESPDFAGAGQDAGVALLLGQLGRLYGPLSKLRVTGFGKGRDAAMVSKAIREADTALQPSPDVADLFDTMRGARGEQAMGAAKAAAEANIAKQLPRAPKPVDRIAHADSPFKAMEPPQPVQPALSREGYEQTTGELTKLGRQGFNLRGAGRDSPQAIAAREQYGETLGKLRGDITKQGGPELLGEMEKGRRDFSAANELRRLFRPNTGEGPDRVFRPGGFNLQDLQERAAKRTQEIQSRLGQASGDEFLKKLFRGGKPGEGTDRAIPLINSSKLGGFRVNLPLTYKAGPQADPMLMQMLMQGGGLSLLDALQQK